MKLSKKIVAVILTVAMAITQLSVFSLADNAYDSGMNDSASYAMKVPDQAYVQYNKPSATTAWVKGNLFRNANDTDYVASGNDRYFHITTVGTEKFLKLSFKDITTPSTNAAMVTTYMTYGTQYGIPSDITNSGTITNMAFRVKVSGVAATEKKYVKLKINTNKELPAGEYTFIDKTTGITSKVKYVTTYGFELTGATDGYIVVGINDFDVALDTLKGTTSSGYKDIRLEGANPGTAPTWGGSKALLLGDSFFITNLDTFKKVHAAPEAPTASAVTENTITLNAVSGVLYAIGDGEFSSNATFTGLEEGTYYTIKAKYDGGTYVSTAEIATKGLVAPKVISATTNLITVEVVDGQEYSLNKTTWSTTGQFLVDAGTEYTIYTQAVGNTDPEKIKSTTTKSADYPYATGIGDKAYYALQIDDLTTKYDSSFVTAPSNVGRNEDDTDAGSYLHVKNFGTEKFIEINVSDENEAVTAVNGAKITYGIDAGIPEELPPSAFTAFVFRIKTSVGTAGKVSAFDIQIGDKTAIDGEYKFIDAATGEVTTLKNEYGFKVADAIDGWLIVPFANITNGTAAVTASELKTSYADIDVVLHGKGCADNAHLSRWNDRTFYLGNVLFMQGEETFLTARSTPAIPTAGRTTTSIKLASQANVEYSNDNGATWVTNGNFTNLTPGTQYNFQARYVGKTAVINFNYSTRYEETNLKAPVMDSITYNSIKVVVEPDHEYSIDGGATWTEKGLFKGLLSGTGYEIVARIVGTTTNSATTIIYTADNEYSSGNGDTGNFMFKVDQSDNTPSNMSVNTVVKDSKSFLELSLTDNKEGSVVIDAADKLYGGIGVPDSIGAENIKGVAFRIIVEGGASNIASAVDFKFFNDRTSVDNLSQVLYIDAVTGEKKEIEYDSALKLVGELNGWILIPIENYPARATNKLKLEYTGFTVDMHGSDCVLHDASWSDWNDKKLYIGDSLFVTDVDAFAKKNSAPEKPELLSKDTNSIYVKPVSGVEYSLDQITWNTTGEFTGLTENTSYAVYARYVGGIPVISFTWFTDTSTPTLVKPVIVGTTQTTITVQAVPSLEHSVDQVNWTEEGIITGLEADKEYRVYVRIKGTTEVGPEFTITSTLAYPNPYATDNKDSGIYFFKIEDNMTKIDATNYGTPSSAIGLDAEGNPGVGGGYLNVVTQNGEKFVEIGTTANLAAANDEGTICFDSSYLYGALGLPAIFDAKDLQAMAIRIKTQGMTKDPAFFTLYLDSYASSVGATSLFIIDAATGEVSPVVNGGAMALTSDVDGWLVIPLSAYETVTPSWLNTSFNGLTVCLHLGKCTHATVGKWADQKLYIGSSVFVTDIDKFLGVHAAPDMPELDSKTTTSITLKAVDGIEYSMDNGASWTITPTFSGLTENTEYTFIAKYTAGTVISEPFTISTDMANPVLTTPTLKTATTKSIQVNVVPGLVYYLEGTNISNETGLFTGLKSNTEYNIFAQVKGDTTGTYSGILTTKTLTPVNSYLNADGYTSNFMMVPTDTDEYRHTYVHANLSAVEGKDSSSGGYANIVEVDGERMIKFTGYNDNGGIFTLTGQYTYGRVIGFPEDIDILNTFGFAIRLKIEPGTNDYAQRASQLYMSYYVGSSSKDIRFPTGASYYLVHKETGTWEEVSAAESPDFINGFDGWLVLPVFAFGSAGAANRDMFQEGWNKVSFFTRGINQTYWNNSSWKNANIYVGDTVLVHDINKFVKDKAPNTEKPVVPEPHNKVTVADIPGVMSNDCTGIDIYNGLEKLSNIKPTIVETTNKPYEDKSEAISFSAPAKDGEIIFTNDAMNLDVITQDHEWQVLDSTGVAFWLEIPQANDNVEFSVEICEQVDEFYRYSSDKFYYTVSNGEAKKIYGSLKFEPGFKGTVLIPFNSFEFDTTVSKIIDGILYNVDTIKHFGITFSEGKGANGKFIVDDFMMYQSYSAYIDYMMKAQGVTGFYEIEEQKPTYRIDLYPDYPRLMANDCTNIDEDKGIYSVDGVELQVIENKDKTDASVNITIGDGQTKVSFINHTNATRWEDISDEEYERLMSSTGISFKVSVPDDAPMTVGLDLEVVEHEESEYFMYDYGQTYYVVEGDKVYLVYGYLEFEKGFDGTVIIPFENFRFDEDYSDYIDGVLGTPDEIDYFSFYFNTEDYVSIGGTTINIDDIAFYQGNYEMIDAVWHTNTGITPNH